MSIVNGLHQLACDVPAIAEAARARGVTIVDVRKPRPKDELHYWSGAIQGVSAPRLAVLGADCASGKRTTARLLRDACRGAGIRAELIFTGQTAGCRASITVHPDRRRTTSWPESWSTPSSPVTRRRRPT